jgi:hypothetical protein
MPTTCTELTNQLADRKLPATARVEAARRLPLECRDYSVWQALCSVVADEREDPVVRCAAVQAMPDWNPGAAVNFLIRAFHSEQVRAVALATLEKVGQVDGWLQAKLLADLSSIGRGDTNAEIHIAGLPGYYGRPSSSGVFARVITQHRQPLSCPGGKGIVLPGRIGAGSKPC